MEKHLTPHACSNPRQRKFTVGKKTKRPNRAPNHSPEKTAFIAPYIICMRKVSIRMHHVARVLQQAATPTNIRVLSIALTECKQGLDLSPTPKLYAKRVEKGGLSSCGCI